MFEQNNVGVRLAHPCMTLIEAMEPGDCRIGEYLAAVEHIASTLEGT